MVNLWMSWMSVLSKKTKTLRKTQKTITSGILNSKMSIRGGPVVTFSLPVGTDRPFAPLSVTPLATTNFGIILYCSRDFLSCICESPATHAKVVNSGSSKMVIAHYRICYFFQKRVALLLLENWYLPLKVVLNL